MLSAQTTGYLFARIVGSIMLFVGCLYGQQIQFNSVYNCPDSSLYTFQVLKCDKDDCEVFFKNNSPEGGWKGELSKARIAAALRKGGCTRDGKPIPTTPAPPATGAAKTPAASVDLGADKDLAAGAACVAAKPAEVATTGRAPSAALIKRVIYERYRDMESGRQVGVTFANLTLASSFVNRLSRGGLPHQSAPVGATIYRYKTDLVTCVKYSDSILRTEIKEGYYRCFRDKTGAWTCTDDGRRSWNQNHLPVR